MSAGKLLMLRYEGKLLTLLVNEGRLISVQVYEDEKQSLVGNIYIGKVQSISKNLNAAFVEIENGLKCFLPLAGIVKAGSKDKEEARTVHNGEELLVQVLRDAVKTKQPFLTTRISISGNYLAMSCGSEKLGLSAKLSDNKKKEVAKFLLEEGLIREDRRCLCVSGCGMVVRTNVENLTDLAPLKKEWQLLTEKMEKLFAVSAYRTCYSCLMKNEQPYLTDLKNYYTRDYDEIITDCEDIFEDLQKYFEGQRQENGMETAPPIRLYNEEYPLQKLYSVKTLLEGALNKRVWLKSGGYLIIEPTEALTVIDVNTGKYETKKPSEETFYHINMEAADEIALQLKLRNLSGIIIVDFINMASKERQRELLKKLDMLVKKDSIRTSVVDITPLGLVEITRKRVSRPLKELM